MFGHKLRQLCEHARGAPQDLCAGDAATVGCGAPPAAGAVRCRKSGRPRQMAVPCVCQGAMGERARRGVSLVRIPACCVTCMLSSGRMVGTGMEVGWHVWVGTPACSSIRLPQSTSHPGLRRCRKQAIATYPSDLHTSPPCKTNAARALRRAVHTTESQWLRPLYCSRRHARATTALPTPQPQFQPAGGGCTGS